MNRRDKKKRLSQFKTDARELLSLLNEWAPIPGSPADEYECLAHRILGELEGRASVGKLAESIAAELQDHFGVAEPESAVLRVSRKIRAWWDEKPRRAEADGPGPRGRA